MKSTNDWLYYIGSARQALTKFLNNYNKHNFKFGKNIAIAIINQDLIDTDSWKPELKKS